MNSHRNPRGWLVPEYPYIMIQTITRMPIRIISLDDVPFNKAFTRRSKNVDSFTGELR